MLVGINKADAELGRANSRLRRLFGCGVHAFMESATSLESFNEVFIGRGIPVLCGTMEMGKLTVTKQNNLNEIVRR